MHPAAPDGKEETIGKISAYHPLFLNDVNDHFSVCVRFKAKSAAHYVKACMSLIQTSYLPRNIDLCMEEDPPIADDTLELFNILRNSGTMRVQARARWHIANATQYYATQGLYPQQKGS